MLETVARVLTLARQPMRAREIHDAAETLGGQPLQLSSVTPWPQPRRDRHPDSSGYTAGCINSRVTNDDMTPQANPDNDGHRQRGGLTISLWLLAIVLAQYLIICWVMMHAYSA
jgi:hypothetical protein